MNDGTLARAVVVVRIMGAISLIAGFALGGARGELNPGFWMGVCGGVIYFATLAVPREFMDRGLTKRLRTNWPWVQTKPARRKDARSKSGSATKHTE